MEFDDLNETNDLGVVFHVIKNSKTITFLHVTKSKKNLNGAAILRAHLCCTTEETRLKKEKVSSQNQREMKEKVSGMIEVIEL